MRKPMHGCVYEPSGLLSDGLLGLLLEEVSGTWSELESLLKRAVELTRRMEPDTLEERELFDGLRKFADYVSVAAAMERRHAPFERRMAELFMSRLEQMDELIDDIRLKSIRELPAWNAASDNRIRVDQAIKDGRWQKAMDAAQEAAHLYIQAITTASRNLGLSDDVYGSKVALLKFWASEFGRMSHKLKSAK